LAQIEIKVEGEPFNSRDYKHRAVQKFLERGNDLNEAIDALEQTAAADERTLKENDQWKYESATKDFVIRDKQAAQYLRENGVPQFEKIKKANLYTVKIKPDVDAFLDWDKPLSGQSEKVRAAYAQAFNTFAAISRIGESERMAMRQNEQDGLGMGFAYSSMAMMAKSPADVSRILKSAGIRGIRYLDGNSRGNYKVVQLPTSGEYQSSDRGGKWKVFSDSTSIGPDWDTQAAAQEHADWLHRQRSYNYVIFDENDIEITHENDKPVTP